MEQRMTPIDVMCFGKFKVSKSTVVGKHTHMKHLFVGGVCQETPAALKLQSQLPLSAVSGGSPKVSPPCPPPQTPLLSNALPNTNKQGS